MKGNAMASRRQFLAAAVPAWLLAQRFAAAAPPQRASTAPRMTPVEAQRWMTRIVPLHEKKRPNQSGDWLESHPENGQTFAQYLKAHPTRVVDQYRTLYLQPLGKFTAEQQKIIDQTADCMQRFFGLPTKINEPLALDDLPSKAKRIHPSWRVRQVLSTHLLYEVLKPRCPRDAAAVLGLTSSDLWPGEGWNFVFGQASLADRVGVWSIYRNGEIDGDETERRMFLRRTLKTALHETGHMLGIPHCIAYECGMNGSNNRSESDRQPLEFCPECQAKVWWTCGAVPLARAQTLRDFAEKAGLTEEAEIWARACQALES
jgi:archaemetzincin